MRIVGGVILAYGIVGVLISARYARWFAQHFRLRRRSPSPTPKQVEGTRRAFLIINFWGSLLLIVIGAMWILGVGTK